MIYAALFLLSYCWEALCDLSKRDGRDFVYRARDSRGRKPQFLGKCDVRLDERELNMLAELSERNGVTRSDIMRRALRDFWKFNSPGGGDN